MYKKILLGISLVIIMAFSFNVCFANDTTNMLQNAGNNVKNAVGDVQKATEDAAKNISGASKDATENVAQKANNVGNELMNGNDNGYTTSRTSTQAADTTFMGMDANTWTWLIVGVAAIAIIALIWYYSMQLRSSDSHRD